MTKMYKSLNSLLYKSVFVWTQYIHRSSNNFSISRIAQICTSTSKYVRFRPSTFQNNEEQAIDNTHKISAKDLLDNAATFIDQVPTNEESKWSTAPYPEGALLRHQSRHALRPHIDPKETSIILFPGQGSQYVGMGKDLLKFPVCRDFFEVANDILKFDLIKLCLQGPKYELDKTANAQIAVLVCSLAAVERLKEERPSAIENCIVTAGLGVGELSALAFAGVLSFERAVRLAQLRGEAMQMASDMVPGGMMTVIYSPDSKLGYALLKAKESASAAGVIKPHISVAKYLFPHCKVIAGNNECLDYIEQNYKKFNIVKVKRLPVAGAFHTELMKPAIEPFKKALRNSNLKEPLIAVHSNYDSKYYKDVNHIVHQFPKQIYRPVRWEQILHVLYERPVGEYFPKTFECGPGNSLKTILKMVNSKAWNMCISVFT